MDPLPLGRCTDKNALQQCSHWAHVICRHCHQGVCLKHYEIHQHDIQIRADRLNNRINDLRQRLHTLTYQQLMEICQEKIDQWSEKCKNEIDFKRVNMSVQLSKEMKELHMERFLSIQLNQIDQDIGRPLLEFLQRSNDQQIKHLEILEQQFEQISQMNSLIQITNDGQLKLNPSIDFIPSVYQHALIDCPGAIAGSPLHHNYLLIFQTKPYFSLVFIEDNKHITRTPIDDFVYDICWSPSTQVFLLITEHYLYEFYPLNNRLSRPYGDWKSTEQLWSLTCDLTDLYIIQKSDMIIDQRDLKRPFEKKRRWSKDDLMCEKDDQMIGSIRADEQKQILGLSIKQIDHRWRVDLFSTDNMHRLHRGLAFGISTESFCMITPLLDHHNQWLVQIGIDEKSQTILLDQNVQVIKQVNCQGYNLTLTDRDKIVFLSQIGIQIYQRKSFV